MDIKKIALKIARRDFPACEVHAVVAVIDEALESYKAELLKEVVGPTCWMTPDGEGWRMRTKPPEIDTKLGWMEFYTSDQVAAAILKATKPLEEEVERLRSELYEAKGGKQ